MPRSGFEAEQGMPRELVPLATLAGDSGELEPLLAALTEGLTDEDLRRPSDFGRSDPEWAT